jgi:ABC-type spermidine/putrescine transport system permease subunit II
MVSLCYRVGHPHQIRRKTTYAPSLFFVFLFLFLIFLPLPQAVTRALSFRAIKGEVGTPSRGIDRETD